MRFYSIAHFIVKTFSDYFRKWTFYCKWWSGGFEAQYFYLELKSFHPMVARLIILFFCSLFFFNLPAPAPRPRRCLYHLLDSWIGVVTSWRVLPTVWRSGLWEVFPSACRVQLCHEPHHLLLPRQGDERHLQADPLLPAQWEHQRPHGRLRPLSVLRQPHHSGWSSQQWPLRGLERKLRWDAAIIYWGMIILPLPKGTGRAGCEREEKHTRVLKH